MKGANSWEKVFPAILGIVGTLLGSAITLVSTGYVESHKVVEQQRSQAIAQYIEAAWGEPSKAEDQWNYTRKLSVLSAYAPRRVLEAIRKYHSTDCARTGDKTQDCRQLWAKVVKELRPMTNADDASEDVLVEVIWGKVGPPDQALPIK